MTLSQALLSNCAFLLKYIHYIYIEPKCVFLWAYWNRFIWLAKTCDHTVDTFLNCSGTKQFYECRSKESLTTSTEVPLQEESVSRSKKSAKDCSRRKANGKVDSAGKPMARQASTVSPVLGSEVE